jgi:alpha-ribazole phosphatase/probable phosphoglycerate mutase
MVRHGQVVGYDRFPAVGHTDIDITDVGILQMEHLAERLRLVDLKAIYASDLKRSVKGAQIIARHHNVPVISLPELREMYFGAWEGLSMSEIQERYPGELERRKEDLSNYTTPGNGESVKALSERIIPCLRGILDDLQESDILLVGHGGVNRVILSDALGLDLANMINLQQDYGCLNIIDYRADSRLVRLMNG